MHFPYLSVSVAKIAYSHVSGGEGIQLVEIVSQAPLSAFIINKVLTDSSQCQNNEQIMVCLYTTTTHIITIRTRPYIRGLSRSNGISSTIVNNYD